MNPSVVPTPSRWSFFIRLQALGTEERRFGVVFIAVPEPLARTREPAVPIRIETERRLFS